MQSASITANSASAPQAGARERFTTGQRLARLRREPLLQFLFIGVLIFAAAQALGQFGNTPIIDALFAGAQEIWSAPVRCGLGWHLVLATRRQDPVVPPFENVHADVQAAYLQDAMDAASRRQRAALRARYEVVRSRAVRGENAP